MLDSQMNDNGGELVYFNGVTRLNLPVNRILDNAPRDMDVAVVIGWDADGDFYFASSVADGADVLWLLEKAKKKLLEIGDK